MPENAGNTIGADLSVTLAPLVEDSSGDAIKAALDRIAALRIRHVQIAATMQGLRPRNLSRSARRDLLASLRRRELLLSGVDAWIPAAHFADAAHVDRAMQTASEIIDLAADLGRVPVSLALPAHASEEAIVRLLIEQAHRVGVALADHAVPPSPLEAVGCGIDPAAWLSLGKDPVAAVHGAAGRLSSARLVDLLRSGMRGPIGNSGDGRLDVAAYKIALAVCGYQKPMVIDARQWSEPWHGVEQTMNAWADAARI